MNKFFQLFIVVKFLTLLCIVVAHASTGEWKGNEQGKVRILSSGGLQENSNSYLLGIEMALEPGWKTYWRHPGESGIPTKFDFSASNNLKESDIFYPVPTNYFDGYGNTIVYFDHVIFPVKIKPTDPDVPIYLHAKLTYGLCEEICIPGEATLSLTLSPFESFDQSSFSMINAALSQVPRPPRENDDISITNIKKITDENGNPRLEITAKVIEDSVEPSLFVFGPADIYIEVPQLIQHLDTESQWYLPLSNLQEGNFELQFILVQESEAIEKKWYLN